MRSKKRQPAHFEVTTRSSVYRATVTWKITVSETGVVAVRDSDRRRVAIAWRELLGSAMFYGCDSSGNGKEAKGL